MPSAIRLDNLVKSFGAKRALDGVSFEVAPGEIFGLLGHNGAGKSTSLGILLGQVYPDSGEAFVSGESVQRNRAVALRRTGAIFEQPRFFDYLSGWRNLQILAGYSAVVPRSVLEDAVEFVGLGERIHDKVGVYSQGMRQRLGLAQALVPAPDVLFLDEPTNGLDPEGIAEMRALIQRLNRERGITVLFCSHLLTEVEQLCERVAVLNRGRLVFCGRWQELRSAGSRFRITAAPWDRAEPLLGCTVVGKTGADSATVELPPGGDIADVVARLAAAGVRIRAVEPATRTLEEIYLDMVARS